MFYEILLAIWCLAWLFLIWEALSAHSLGSLTWELHVPMQWVRKCNSRIEVDT